MLFAAWMKGWARRAMWTFIKVSVPLFTFCAVSISCQSAETGPATAETGHELRLERQAPSVWETALGEGFRSSDQTLTLAAGAFNGLAIFGGSHTHDLALTSLSYSHMLTHTVGQGHWYRGNWEFRGELFGGVEFAPSSEWVIGLAPHLRYSFATGTLFVPYIDAGAGVTATSIGPPDLSNIFEFNLQATAGTYIFLRDNLALTLEARFLHLSCAGISDPNRGVNGIGGMLGLTLFF